MSEYYSKKPPYRSFFWPVILLGAGVIWLLSNLNIIPAENLWLLLQLWPVLIIMAGLDILFSRRWPLVGAILALLTLTGVVLILVNGGFMQVGEIPQPQTESLVVEKSEAESVYFDLQLSTSETSVSSLTGSDNLVEAVITHFGVINLEATGTEEKQIRLEQTGSIPWFQWLLPEVQEQKPAWNIRLNPDVPFILDVDASTGRSVFDLAGIQLDEFLFDGSTGDSTIIFPVSSQGYEARIDASTGEIDITFPVETNLAMIINGSTGRIFLTIPEDAAVQVEVVSGGTGDLFLPDWIEKVSGKEDRDEGVYQSPGYDSAASKIAIVIEDISTGNIVIK